MEDKRTDELRCAIRSYMNYYAWINFAAGVFSGSIVTYAIMKK